MQAIKYLVLIFLCGNISLGAQHQSVDSTRYKTSLLGSSVFSVGLMTVGAIINQSDFEKELQVNLRNKVGNNYRTYIDDYIVFGPVAEMYLADILGVSARNHWFDQSKNLFMVNLIGGLTTHALKIGFNKTRPSGGGHSFPSGHTSFAFANAGVLYHEYKDTSPLLAYSGFGFATATGGLRMANNRHWLSDVLLGAGIGILSAHIIYHFKPFKDYNPFLKTKNITLIPNVSFKEYGFYFAYRL
ncbi:MAG: phosphatase PAP2 family protein [Saprospiraceae bacterium]